MAKFLANENVPSEAVAAARHNGYDVKWIGEVAPGVDDEAVLSLARQDGRVLITFDKDFGKLVFRLGKLASPGIVLMRPRLRSANSLAEYMVSVLAQDVQWDSHFVVAQEGKLRVVPLPD